MPNLDKSNNNQDKLIVQKKTIRFELIGKFFEKYGVVITHFHVKSCETR